MMIASFESICSYYMKITFELVVNISVFTKCLKQIEELVNEVKNGYESDSSGDF